MPQTIKPTAPHDILMNLIVAFLAPMFLSACGGDITHARMAAIETVNAYRSRNHTDLIAIAQIIAFGLAALNSLSQSMADNVSRSMSLRLKANAITLNRSSERNRNAPTASQAPDTAPRRSETTSEPVRPNHSPVISTAPGQQPEAQAVTQSAAERHAKIPATTIPTTTIPATTIPGPAATPVEMTAEKRHQRLWALAMVKEAQKITASIPSLPPAERRAAAIRAGALSSTANELLSGASTPRDPARK